MWELDHKESWGPKNWCFWTLVLEKTLESPLDCEEIQPVHPKGNQSWIFIGRTDAEAETPRLWPPDAKNWLIEQDPDGEKDWRQEEKGTTENEMVRWHHWLNGHEFEQNLEDSERQGILTCCSPWGWKESDMTEWHTSVNKDCCLLAQSCPTLCHPMDCSTPAFPVLHYIPEFAQTHVHRVGDAVQPSHTLSSPSPAFNLSQHQGLFQWVGFSHRVAKVLQLQRQSFQCIFRVDFL